MSRDLLLRDWFLSLLDINSVPKHRKLLETIIIKTYITSLIDGSEESFKYIEYVLPFKKISIGAVYYDDLCTFFEEYYPNTWLTEIKWGFYDNKYHIIEEEQPEIVVRKFSEKVIWNNRRKVFEINLTGKPTPQTYHHMSVRIKAIKQK